MNKNAIHIILIIFIMILLYKNCTVAYFDNQSISIFDGDDTNGIDVIHNIDSRIYPFYSQTTFDTLYDK